MATKSECSIYHLTPAGWVVGESAPPDRVESWNCRVEDAGRGKRYVEWTRIWTNPEVRHAERDRLRRHFWDFADSGTVVPASRSVEAGT